MGRTRRYELEPSTPPPDLPPADPPSSSTRKRPREGDANSPKPTTSTKEVGEGLGAPLDASSDERPSKKSKGEAEMEQGDNRDEVEQPILPHETPKSASDSSDTLAESVTNGEAANGGETEMKESEESRNSLDSLSAEERRKLKGKGKATEDENDESNGGESDELSRMKRELAFKNSVRRYLTSLNSLIQLTIFSLQLISSQSSLLSNFRSAVACTVCLETLDKPYALACGHVL